MKFRIFPVLLYVILITTFIAYLGCIHAKVNTEKFIFYGFEITLLIIRRFIYLVAGVSCLYQYIFFRMSECKEYPVLATYLSLCVWAVCTFALFLGYIHNFNDSNPSISVRFVIVIIAVFITIYFQPVFDDKDE